MKIESRLVLSADLERAKHLLEEVLGILDDHREAAAACLTCAAIEKLIEGPSTLEQWLVLTDRCDPDASDTKH